MVCRLRCDCSGGQTVHFDNKTGGLGDIAANQWQANFFTRTFLDLNKDGISSKDYTGTPCTAPNTPNGCNANYGTDTEPGLTFVKTNVRFRDGSFSNRNNTDLNGYAAFNEEFPLFSWYVIETDTTRYKNTGTHVVYDAGGPADGTPCGATPRRQRRPAAAPLSPIIWRIRSSRFPCRSIYGYRAPSIAPTRTAQASRSPMDQARAIRPVAARPTRGQA